MIDSSISREDFRERTSSARMAILRLFGDGKSERCTGEYLVKVGEDAEVILFSPQYEHSKVIDHMLDKMGA